MSALWGEGEERTTVPHVRVTLRCSGTDWDSVLAVFCEIGESAIGPWRAANVPEVAEIQEALKRRYAAGG